MTDTQLLRYLANGVATTQQHPLKYGLLDLRTVTHKQLSHYDSLIKTQRLRDAIRQLSGVTLYFQHCHISYAILQNLVLNIDIRYGAFGNNLLNPIWANSGIRRAVILSGRHDAQGISINPNPNFSNLAWH
jgi:hypothetical protein